MKMARSFMMCLKVAAVVGAVTTLFAGQDAKADVVYVLSDVHFDDGGSIQVSPASSFTLNNYGYLASWNIVTIGGSFAETYTTQANFGGINTTSGGPVGNVLTFLPNDATEYANVLQLTFSAPLGTLVGNPLQPVLEGAGIHTIEGGTLSYECIDSFSCYTGTVSGTRYVEVSADIHPLATAVPEPSTWAMMILGFAGIGFMAYRRKSRVPLAAA
jgi:PEP-CTERM motif